MDGLLNRSRAASCLEAADLAMGAISFREHTVKSKTEII